MTAGRRRLPGIDPTPDAEAARGRRQQRAGLLNIRMVVVGANNDIVDALGAATIAAARGNTVGRLGRGQTHRARDFVFFFYCCTQIIHGTRKHVGLPGSLIALINFMPFHRRGGKINALCFLLKTGAIEG